MNRNNLKLAMPPTDGAYADHMLAEAEAAHQAEREAEQTTAERLDASTAQFEDEHAAHEAEIAADAARQAEQSIRDQIEQDQRKSARANMRSFSVVTETLIESGHDPRHIPEAASSYQDAIAKMLLEIANMAKGEKRQFGSDSSRAEIERGVKVGAIFGGGQ